MLLKVARLPRSTYYYQRGRDGSADEALLGIIRRIFERHKGRYGYRRVALALRREGHAVNHKRVQRLMVTGGLRSTVRPKRYRSYRGEEGRAAPNIVSRNFTAEAPFQTWFTDVTEFNVNGEKLYLSPLMDAFNGEIISFRTSRHPNYALVGEMLQGAVRDRECMEGLTVHSDQGWQYRHANFRGTLKRLGIRQSMSRKGNCLDNARMESFFATLKAECFHRHRFDSVESLDRCIREYYNLERIQGKLKGLSPVEYRTQTLLGT